MCNTLFSLSFGAKSAPVGPEGALPKELEQGSSLFSVARVCADKLRPCPAKRTDGMCATERNQVHKRPILKG